MEKQTNIPAWFELAENGAARVSLRMPVAGVKRGDWKVANLQVNPQSVEDVIPKPEDWLLAKFRAISAAYLGEEGYWLDFSKPGVLLASIPLMITKGAGGTRRRPLKFHRNHIDRTENIIGYISAASWGEAGGEQNYPGVNIDVMIDYKLAPNECRQIMAEPPLVESCSISIYFNWEQSHPNLESWQFWSLIGEEIDGQIVRIMVTEIIEYRHVALVHEGADEEADKLGKKEDSGLKMERQKQNLGGNTMKFILSDEQVASLAKALGVAALATPEELLNSALQIAAANENMRSELNDLTVKAGQLDKLLGEKREAVKALVIKVDGENTKGTQAVIANLEWAALGELETEYSAKLEAKVPVKCMACGSTNCERRSSVEEPPKAGDGPAEKPLRESNFR